MTTVYARAQALCDAITAAGIRATLDQRNVNPPCALVTMPTVVYDLHAGHLTATWRILAIAPGPPSADSFRALWDTDGILPHLDTIDEIHATEANPVQFSDTTTTVEITWQEAQ